MEKKTNMPALHFRGFSEEWEKKKIRDIAKIVGGGTPSTQDPHYWGGDIDWYAPAEMEGKRYADGSERKITALGLEKSGAQLLPANRTVLFTSRAGIGKMAILKKTAATNQGFQSLVLKENINPYFIYSMGAIIKTKAEQVASGSTFLEISGPKLGDLDINIPHEIEQNKIAKLFISLDDLICEQKEKIKKLEQFRRAMLSKLFPAEGESEPALRFRGFSGAWKKCKLASFGKATGGVSLEAEFIENGTYKVINIGSYSGESKYIDQGLRTNKTKRTAARILNKNDLVMILNDKTSEGNIIGRVLLIDADDTYVYNQRNERIEVNRSQFVPQFLYELLNADVVRNKIIRAAQGATQIYVNWSVISQLTYMIPPSINEQKQIGDFFYQLDSYISLQKEKREKLRRLKAALLEKLFV